jgi:hypothetical protein
LTAAPVLSYGQKELKMKIIFIFKTETVTEAHGEQHDDIIGRDGPRRRHAG